MALKHLAYLKVNPSSSCLPSTFPKFFPSSSLYIKWMASFFILYSKLVILISPCWFYLWSTQIRCLLSSHWCFNSFQFSCSVVYDSLQPHELQHTRPPCPPPTPRVYPNSCPLSQWYHPTVSSSVVPFFSCLQSFPASRSFQMSQLFTSNGWNIGVSASTSVLPVNTQDWFPLGWTGWISLQSKGLSRVFSNTTVQKHQFCTQLSL